MKYFSKYNLLRVYFAIVYMMASVVVLLDLFVWRK